MHSRTPRSLAAALILAVLPVSAGQAAAAGFELLAPHRAIYDLKLRAASDRSGIEAMNGRIVYEITGNECDGMTIRYRFVTDITTADSAYRTDQQTSTFESPDGKEFSFLTKTFVDDRPDTSVRGTAIRAADGLHVSLSEPQKRELLLPDASFISTHLVQVIEHARKGDLLVKRAIFDGSEGADEVVTSSTVVGAPRTVSETLPGEKAEAVRPVANEKAWPITISYFDADPGRSAEALPNYEASFLLYPNGVSRKLVMRYPDYSLTGELTGLEMLKRTSCKKQN